MTGNLLLEEFEATEMRSSSVGKLRRKWYNFYSNAWKFSMHLHSKFKIPQIDNRWGCKNLRNSVKGSLKITTFPKVQQFIQLLTCTYFEKLQIIFHFSSLYTNLPTISPIPFVTFPDDALFTGKCVKSDDIFSRWFIEINFRGFIHTNRLFPSNIFFGSMCFCAA